MIEGSARTTAGADGGHPLTSASPMTLSAIHQGRRERSSRTCRGIFRTDTVFILEHTDTLAGTDRLGWRRREPNPRLFPPSICEAGTRCARPRRVRTLREVRTRALLPTVSEAIASRCIRHLTVGMTWRGGTLRALLNATDASGPPARLAVLGGCDVSVPQDPFRYRPHPSAYAGAKERRAKRRPAKIILVSGGIPCGCGCGEITNVVTRTERARGRIAGAPYRFVSGHNLRLLRGAA